MSNALVINQDESCIFFTVGGYNYAFDTRHVLDIIQLVELGYPESMPDFIAGLLEYNGQIIKVIDIKTILKLEKTPYGVNSKIIIAKTRSEVFGIIADDIKKIHSINAEFFNAPPYDTEKSYLEGIYTDRELSSTILNLEQIEKKINSEEAKGQITGNASFELLPKDSSSKEILSRRLEHYAEKTRRVTYEIIKSRDTYITFKLNNSVCCAKIIGVAGFYKFLNLKLTKVPCTPDFIIGVTNINGRYITIVDLLKYTENKAVEISKDTTVIVIEYEDYQLGILSDGIGETIEIDENLIKLNADKSPDCLHEFVVNGQLYVFLDAKKLFGDEKLYVS